MSTEALQLIAVLVIGLSVLYLIGCLVFLFATPAERRRDLASDFGVGIATVLILACLMVAIVALVDFNLTENAQDTNCREAAIETVPHPEDMDTGELEAIIEAIC